MTCLLSQKGILLPHPPETFSSVTAINFRISIEFITKLPVLYVTAFLHSLLDFPQLGIRCLHHKVGKLRFREVVSRKFIFTMRKRSSPWENLGRFIAHGNLISSMSKWENAHLDGLFLAVFGGWKKKKNVWLLIWNVPCLPSSEWVSHLCLPFTYSWLSTVSTASNWVAEYTATQDKNSLTVS